MKSPLFKSTGALLGLLVLGVSSAAAQLIQPSGVPVGSDKQGHAIYRVPANGIEIGYKLMGAGEPLVMITGLGGTMESWPQEVLEAFANKHQLILMDNRPMWLSKRDGFAIHEFVGGNQLMLDIFNAN